MSTMYQQLMQTKTTALAMECKILCVNQYYTATLMKQVKKSIQTAPVHTIHNVLVPDGRAILLQFDCIIEIETEIGVGVIQCHLTCL